MRGGKENISIAIAIHPTEVYYEHPAKKEIQQALYNGEHNLSIVVNHAMYNGSRAKTYVIAAIEWMSPTLTGFDIENGVREKKYGHGYNIINPEDLSKFNKLYDPEELSVMLVGGEVGGPEGCHHAAFIDLIEWFYTFSSRKLKILKIIIPLNALFTSSNANFNFADKTQSILLQKRYAHNRASEFHANSEEIVIVFMK